MRHSLAEAAKRMTDGKVKITGRQKFNLIDATNRVLVRRAMSMAEKLKWGSWALVKAYNKDENVAKLCNQHNKNQKDLPKTQKCTFESPLTNLADKSGFIIFKDKKIVIFYTNDLAFTPSRDLLLRRSDEAEKAVNFLGIICWWTGNESLTQTEFLVPNVIVACNKFIGGIDRLDQIRAAVNYQNKEQRLDLKFCFSS